MRVQIGESYAKDIFNGYFAKSLLEHVNADLESPINPYLLEIRYSRHDFIKEKDLDGLIEMVIVLDREKVDNFNKMPISKYFKLEKIDQQWFVSAGEVATTRKSGTYYRFTDYRMEQIGIRVQKMKMISCIQKDIKLI